MNIQNLMKQAQAMQAGVMQAQARVAKMQITTEAAGGKVKATVNGAGELLELHIDPAIVDPEDVDFLETMVLKTVQDALKQAKEKSEEEIRKVTGGLGLPM